MKLAESLEAFRKVNSRKEWEKWIENYCESHGRTVSGNFYMDRYSYYDFKRYNSQYACLEQLVAFEEYEEYFVLKDEYC